MRQIISVKSFIEIYIKDYPSTDTNSLLLATSINHNIIKIVNTSVNSSISRANSTVSAANSSSGGGFGGGSSGGGGRWPEEAAVEVASKTTKKTGYKSCFLFVNN